MQNICCSSSIFVTNNQVYCCWICLTVRTSLISMSPQFDIFVGVFVQTLFALGCLYCPFSQSVLWTVTWLFFSPQSPWCLLLVVFHGGMLGLYIDMKCHDIVTHWRQVRLQICVAVCWDLLYAARLNCVNVCMLIENSTFKRYKWCRLYMCCDF